MKRKLLFALISFVGISAAYAQSLNTSSLLKRNQFRDPIPMEISEMYERGIDYLVSSQNADGSWSGGNYSKSPGVAGLCVVSIMAYGEDPNYGPHAETIKKGLDYIIKSQNERGFLAIQNNMYEHGFATLALAEAYGAVNDARLGPALQKAVDLLLSSQKRNREGAWRYQPNSTDADSTLAGAQVVALYAARNAGIEIPDEAFEKSLNYFNKMQSGDGGMGYSSPGASNLTRSAIGLLIYSLARVNETSEEAKRVLEYCQENLNQGSSYPFYNIYYVSQALFQADYELFLSWSAQNVQVLQASQLSDGSWAGSYGNPLATSFSLLSMALNYRYLPIYER